MPRLVSILVASLFASNLLACGGGASASRGVETSEAGPRYAQPDLFGHCPSGTHSDDCAHGSCEHCDDCVAECVFE